MELPEKFLEKYSKMEQEELLEALYNSEQANVKNKKEVKNNQKESSKTIEDLQKQIDELKKGSSKTELDIFLKDKKLSEDQRKSFDEMVKKGYEKEDALKLSTLDSEKQKTNQEEISKNVLDGDDDDRIDNNTITMEKLSTLSQEEYNKTMDQVDAGKIEIVEKK